MTASTHEVLGREVSMPVQIRAATAFTSMVSVSAAAAQRLIDHTGLQVLRWRPGRAVCVLVFVDYVDGDLGPYNEFGVCLLVRGHGRRGGGVLSDLRSLVRGQGCAYIHRLPVDGDFTLAAGRGIWGFPKTLAEFDVDHEAPVKRGSLRADGALIASLEVSPGVSVPDSPSATTLTAYSHLDGVTRATPWSMRAAQTRTRPGGASLTLGAHPFADELRALDIGRTLMSSSVGAFTMTFGDAETV
ncbi:acetoacetate decarboxylase family protein [Williamsia maris]|uniref:Acetoacetate decarboxylase (ADC) n=1 Tax=Williamsia maris TaxID=72806 RepID=A0ABT1HGF8_9NOCA|nr:acetoacetate decarboxylase family protein [Williamsia maris]MCP2177279.1 Acetoacetate decarboxylase (ADC) [Williamsia maris]